MGTTVGGSLGNLGTLLNRLAQAAHDTASVFHSSSSTIDNTGRRVTSNLGDIQKSGELQGDYLLALANFYGANPSQGSGKMVRA